MVIYKRPFTRSLEGLCLMTHALSPTSIHPGITESRRSRSSRRSLKTRGRTSRVPQAHFFFDLVLGQAASYLLQFFAFMAGGYLFVSNKLSLLFAVGYVSHECGRWPRAWPHNRIPALCAAPQRPQRPQRPQWSSGLVF